MNTHRYRDKFDGGRSAPSELRGPLEHDDHGIRVGRDRKRNLVVDLRSGLSSHKVVAGHTKGKKIKDLLKVLSLTIIIIIIYF